MRLNWLKISTPADITIKKLVPLRGVVRLSVKIIEARYPTHWRNW
jgi:hypothetical protein